MIKVYWPNQFKAAVYKWKHRKQNLKNTEEILSLNAVIFKIYSYPFQFSKIYVCVGIFTHFLVLLIHNGYQTIIMNIQKHWHYFAIENDFITLKKLHWYFFRKKFFFFFCSFHHYHHFSRNTWFGMVLLLFKNWSGICYHKFLRNIRFETSEYNI